MSKNVHPKLANQREGNFTVEQKSIGNKSSSMISFFTVHSLHLNIKIKFIHRNRLMAKGVSGEPKTEAGAASGGMGIECRGNDGTRDPNAASGGLNSCGNSPPALAHWKLPEAKLLCTILKFVLVKQTSISLQSFECVWFFLLDSIRSVCASLLGGGKSFDCAVVIDPAKRLLISFGGDVFVPHRREASFRLKVCSQKSLDCARKWNNWKRSWMCAMLRWKKAFRLSNAEHKRVTRRGREEKCVCDERRGRRMGEWSFTTIENCGKFIHADLHRALTAAGSGRSAACGIIRWNEALELCERGI